ncbi:MAG: M42 family metallopeptidase [Turicibacter sp.]
MTKLDQTLTFLKELTDANAVPGQEKEARLVMKKYVEDSADKVYQDHIGSLIAEKVGLEGGPKVIIAGHMDEVGFMVKFIEDKGFIRFQTLGGWWSQVMLAQQVTVTTSTGKTYHGVIGSTPPHILSPEARSKVVDIKEMYIDLGVESKEEVEKLGIRPGDMITPYIEFKQMANEKFLLAKAWDNRVGCAIAVDVLRKLKEESHPNIVYGVGTVQEEVGCRGARTVAQLINPAIAFAADVGIAGDVPGVGANSVQAKMGKGPIITLMDAGLVGHKGLRDFVISVADELNIPYQFDTMPGGGTDAGPMHLAHEGCPAMSIGIASRYIHSHTSMIHRDDYDYAVKLLVEVTKRLDQETVNKIIFE